MFNLFEPTSFKDKSSRWAAKVPAYPFVFGLSPFADLFVCSSDRCDFAVITTEKPELIQLKSSSVKDFVEGFLGSEKVRDDFFRQPDFRALCQTHGPLGKDECFFPVPFRAVGGTGALDTYQRGDAWVHLDIYGQTIGL